MAEPVSKKVDVFNVLRDTFIAGADPYGIAEGLLKNNYQWFLNDDVNAYREANPSLSPGQIDQIYEWMVSGAITIQRRE